MSLKECAFEDLRRITELAKKKIIEMITNPEKTDFDYRQYVDYLEHYKSNPPSKAGWIVTRAINSAIEEYDKK